MKPSQYGDNHEYKNHLIRVIRRNDHKIDGIYIDFFIYDLPDARKVKCEFAEHISPLIFIQKYNSDLQKAIDAIYEAGIEKAKRKIDSGSFQDK